MHRSIQILGKSQSSAYRTLRLQALREWPPAFSTLAEEEARLSEIEIVKRLTPSIDQRLYGAYVEGILVGIARLTRYSGSNERHRAEIGSMYVAPDHRRHGLGKLLLQTCINAAKNNLNVRRLNLSVVSTQTAAISLYRSLGFEPCGVDYEAFSARKTYFDEVLMTMRV